MVVKKVKVTEGVGYPNIVSGCFKITLYPLERTREEFNKLFWSLRKHEIDYDKFKSEVNKLNNEPESWFPEELLGKRVKYKITVEVEALDSNESE